MPSVGAFHIVVCPSCTSTYPIERAGENCDGCGSALPQRESLPSLEGTPRYVGTFSSLKGLGDSVSQHYERQNMLKNVEEGIVAEALVGPVQCGWCGTQLDRRPDSPLCPNCGGPLPKPPGVDPGKPAPDAPRKLPKEFLWRVYASKNVGAMVGAGFLAFGLLVLPAGVCFFGLLMVAFGALCFYANAKTARRRHLSLANGEQTIGIIEKVNQFGVDSKRETTSTMYQVYFRFIANGELVQGMKATYDPSIKEHFIGEPVWVVYLPNDVDAYDLWPPLA